MPKHNVKKLPSLFVRRLPDIMSIEIFKGKVERNCKNKNYLNAFADKNKSLDEICF